MTLPTLEELALLLATAKTLVELARETTTWLQNMKRPPVKKRRKARRKRH